MEISWGQTLFPRLSIYLSTYLSIYLSLYRTPQIGGVGGTRYEIRGRPRSGSEGGELRGGARRVGSEPGLLWGER